MGLVAGGLFCSMFLFVPQSYNVVSDGKSIQLLSMFLHQCSLCLMVLP